MTDAETAALVAMLIAAYPAPPWPGSTQAVYRASLSDFTYADGRRAVERLVASAKFRPSIAEVRREIIEDTLGLPSEIEAWEMALAHGRAILDAPTLDCIQCAGRGTKLYPSEDACPECKGTGIRGRDLTNVPAVDDQITRAAKFVGGWRAILHADRPDLKRRDFCEAYSKLVAEVVETENLRRLGALSVAPPRPELTERTG